VTGIFFFADIDKMVVLFDLIYCIMGLMYKWHWVVTRYDGDVTIYVEHSDDESDEYDTAY